MTSPDSPAIAAPELESRAVPVDLSGWFSGDEAAKDAVAAAVDAACASSGFLAVTGHRVPQELMQRTLDAYTSFFDRPLEEKLRSRIDDLTANRGYAPHESEALSYSLGEESLPDLFEAFNVGPEHVPAGIDPEAQATFFATNVWPEDMPELKATVLEYWAAVEDLGRTLCSVMARALGLADDFFEPYLTACPSVLRANNYQRRAEHGVADPGQLRMGAHSDYGSITILLADPVPGLQIRDRAGEFHDVLPPEGGFLVNLGDLLAEWTNDRWRSTVHRVVPPPADVPGEFRRRSLAWFQQPNHDAVIEVLDVCTGPDNPPRYPTVTAGGHLLAKLMGPREGHESDVDEAFLARPDQA